MLIKGILKCQIMEDNLEDVGQQLELLTETQEAIVTNPVRLDKQ